VTRMTITLNGGREEPRPKILMTDASLPSVLLMTVRDRQELLLVEVE